MKHLVACIIIFLMPILLLFNYITIRNNSNNFNYDYITTAFNNFPNILEDYENDIEKIKTINSIPYENNTGYKCSTTALGIETCIYYNDSYSFERLLQNLTAIPLYIKAVIDITITPIIKTMQWTFTYIF